MKLIYIVYIVCILQMQLAWGQLDLRSNVPYCCRVCTYDTVDGTFNPIPQFFNLQVIEVEDRKNQPCCRHVGIEAEVPLCEYQEWYHQARGIDKTLEPCCNSDEQAGEQVCQTLNVGCVSNPNNYYDYYNTEYLPFTRFEIQWNAPQFFNDTTVEQVVEEKKLDDVYKQDDLLDDIKKSRRRLTWEAKSGKFFGISDPTNTQVTIKERIGYFRTERIPGDSVKECKYYNWNNRAGAQRTCYAMIPSARSFSSAGHYANSQFLKFHQRTIKVDSSDEFVNLLPSFSPERMDLSQQDIRVLHLSTLPRQTQCEFMGECGFSFWDNINGFIARSSNIHQLSGSIQGRYGGSKTMQWMDLSQNHLTSLPKDLLYEGISGTIFNISHNQLTTLPDGFFFNSQLKGLDLSHNKFTDELFANFSRTFGNFFSNNVQSGWATDGFFAGYNQITGEGFAKWFKDYMTVECFQVDLFALEPIYSCGREWKRWNFDGNQIKNLSKLPFAYDDFDNRPQFFGGPPLVEFSAEIESLSFLDNPLEIIEDGWCKFGRNGPIELKISTTTAMAIEPQAFTQDSGNCLFGLGGCTGCAIDKLYIEGNVTTTEWLSNLLNTGVAQNIELINTGINLTDVFMSNNIIHPNVREFIVDGCSYPVANFRSNVYQLTLKNCGIKEIDRVTVGGSSLVDLSDNEITIISELYTNDKGSIETIDLRNNRITDQSILVFPEPQFFGVDGGIWANEFYLSGNLLTKIPVRFTSWNTLSYYGDVNELTANDNFRKLVTKTKISNATVDYSNILNHVYTEFDWENETPLQVQVRESLILPTFGIAPNGFGVTSGLRLKNVNITNMDFGDIFRNSDVLMKYFIIEGMTSADLALDLPIGTPSDPPAEEFRFFGEIPESSGYCEYKDFELVSFVGDYQLHFGENNFLDCADAGVELYLKATTHNYPEWVNVQAMIDEWNLPVLADGSMVLDLFNVKVTMDVSGYWNDSFRYEFTNAVDITIKNSHTTVVQQWNNDILENLVLETPSAVFPIDSIQSALVLSTLYLDVKGISYNNTQINQVFTSIRNVTLVNQDITDDLLRHFAYAHTIVVKDCKSWSVTPEGLSSLKFLSSLTIDHCGLTSLDEIKGVDLHLYALHLQNNNIQQLDGLDDFIYLGLLTLDGNRISDVTNSDTRFPLQCTIGPIVYCPIPAFLRQCSDYPQHLIDYMCRTEVPIITERVVREEGDKVVIVLEGFYFGTSGDVKVAVNATHTVNCEPRYWSDTEITCEILKTSLGGNLEDWDISVFREVFTTGGDVIPTIQRVQSNVINGGLLLNPKAILFNSLLGFAVALDLEATPTTFKANDEPANGLETCSELFAESTMALLGDGPTCTWVNIVNEASYSLEVIFGNFPKLNLEDVLLIKQSNIQLKNVNALESTFFALPDIPVAVVLPADYEIFTPVARIISPVSTGRCNKFLVLNGLSSYGFQGRRGLASWTCGTTNLASFQYDPSSQDSKKDAFRLKLTPEDVDMCIVSNGGNLSDTVSVLEVTLKLTNFLSIAGEESSSTVTILRYNNEIVRPQLIIRGPRKKKYNRAFRVRARVSHPHRIPVSASCLATHFDTTVREIKPYLKGFKDFTYNWTVASMGGKYDTSNTYVLPADLVGKIQGTKHNNIRIPRKALKIGSTFEFDVEVGYNDVDGNPAVLNAKHNVTILSPHVVSHIDGGNRIVDRNEILVLDGRLSFTPHRNIYQPTYQWSCVDQVRKSSCNGFISGISTDSVLQVPAGVLGANKVYQFTLRFAHRLNTKRVQARKTSVIITVKEDRAISVKIGGCISYVNAHQPLKLLGSLETLSGDVVVSQSWTETNQNLEIVRNTDLSVGSLSLLPNQLSPGTRYEFVYAVTITDVNGIERTGNASCETLVNRPPQQGTYVIEPANHYGIAFETEFVVTAFDWIDSDSEEFRYSISQTFASARKQILNGVDDATLPEFTNEEQDVNNIPDLFYQFSYVSDEPGSDTTEILISGLSADNEITTTLPTGVWRFNIYVIDNAGARQKVTTARVSVTNKNADFEIIDNECDILNTTDSLLGVETLNTEDKWKNLQILTDLLDNTRQNIGIQRADCTNSGDLQDQLFNSYLDLLQELMNEGACFDGEFAPLLDIVSTITTNLNANDIDNANQILDIALNLIKCEQGTLPLFDDKDIIAVVGGPSAEVQRPVAVVDVTDLHDVVVGTIGDILDNIVPDSEVCSLVQGITDIFNELSFTSQYENLPSENVGSYTKELSTSSERMIYVTYQSETAIETEVGKNGRSLQGDYLKPTVLNSPAVSVPNEVFAANGAESFVDVVLNEFSSALTSCRSSNNTEEEVVSNVVTIDIWSNGTDLPVEDLIDPIVFYIPYVEPTTTTLERNPATCTDDGIVEVTSSANERSARGEAKALEGLTLRCEYWDATENTWSSEGCTTELDGHVLPNGMRAAKCSCVHLTDFALLLRTKQCETVVGSTALYYTFTGLYSVLCVFSLIQLARGFYYSKKVQGSLWVYSHVLVALVCICRIIFTGVTGSFAESDGVISITNLFVVTSLPYLFMYWIFLVQCFYWIAIYHYALSSPTNPFKKVKKWFVLVNLVIILVLGSMFLSLGATTDEAKEADIAKTGSIVIGILDITLATLFFVYGYGLMRELTKNQSSSSSGSSSKKSSKNNSAVKIFRFACAFALFLLAQGAVVLATGFSYDDFTKNPDTYNGLFFAFDIAALLCVVLMFCQTIGKLNTSKYTLRGTTENKYARRQTESNVKSDIQMEKVSL